MTPQAWQLQLALGACRAGRLLAAASLACALFALAMLADHAPAGIAARVLWSLAVLAALPALYLGVRLELDRGLFQRLADAEDASGGDLAALDRAMVELGLVAGGGTTRTLADRTSGVFRLTRRLGGVVGVQLMLMLVAAWFTGSGWN
jgi:hypothetical protein